MIWRKADSDTESLGVARSSADRSVVRFLCFRKSRLSAECGVTILELLIAGLLSLIVLLGFAELGIGRIFLTTRVRNDSGLHTEISYAMQHILKNLERADRYFRQPNVAGKENIALIRVMTDGGGDPFDVDEAADYEWVQYHHDTVTDQIILNNVTQNACAAPIILAENITKFSAEFIDEAADTPGFNDPLVFGADNNMLLVSMVMEDPRTNIEMRLETEVAMRNGAYTGYEGGVGGIGTPIPEPAVCLL